MAPKAPSDPQPLTVRPRSAPRKKIKEEKVSYAAVAAQSRDRRAEVEWVNETLDTLLAGTRDAFTTLDHQWRFTYVNDHAARVAGIEKDQLLGKCIWDIFPHLQNTNLFRESHRALEQQQPAHFEDFYPSACRWIEHRVYPYPGGLSIFTADITERKRSEETSRDKEERIRFNLEAANVGTWDWNISTGTVQWSENMEQVHGQQPGSFGGTIDAFVQGIHPVDRSRVLKTIDQTIKAGGVYDIEYRQMTARGEVKWMEGKGRVTRDGSGQPVRMMGVCMDVTERKRMQAALEDAYAELENRVRQRTADLEKTNTELRNAVEALMESEQRLHSIMDSSPSIMFIKDIRGRYVYANPEFQKLCRLTREQIAAKTDSEIFSPEQAEAFRLNDLQVLRTGEAIKFEEVALQEDGLHTSVVTKFPLRDAHGNAEGICGIVTDITERKRSEEALQESEARLRLMLDSLPAIVWTTDEKLMMTSSLGKGLARVNLKPNQTTGASLYDAVPASDPGYPAIPAHLRALKGESSNYVAEWQGAIYQTRVEPWRDAAGKIVGCIGLSLDVTEQKHTEHALAQSEDQFRSLIEGTRDYAIFMLDPQGCILSWNLGAERINGYKAGEIIGKHFSVFYPDEDIKSGKPQHGLKIAAAEGRFTTGGWRIRKDGSRFWADVVITALYDGGNHLRGFSKVTRDVTERKRAQEQLSNSEHKFRSIAESANQAIITCDCAGSICSWNRGAQVLFGYAEEEVLGKPLVMLMPDRYRVHHQNGVERLRSGKEPRILGKTIEVYGLRKDGVEFPIELSLSGWRSGDDEFYTGIISDLSIRKKAENWLRQLSGRLLEVQDEERRRMARDLHDSTAQTLSALSLSLALVNQCADFTQQPKVAKAIAESLDLADQASRELRTFSYLLHPPLLDEVGLADALRWYVAGFTKRTHIEVELTISPGSFGRLDQDVETALFRVAQESLTNIYRHSGSSTAAIRLALEPGEIVLEVRDYGKGLPPGMQVSNDDWAVTLGVGLRGMRERVRQLRGRMEVRSVQPGTSVEVVLPRHSGGDGHDSKGLAS